MKTSPAGIDGIFLREKKSSCVQLVLTISDYIGEYKGEGGWHLYSTIVLPCNLIRMGMMSPHLIRHKSYDEEG